MKKHILCTAFFLTVLLSGLAFFYSTFFFVTFSLDRYIIQAMKDWHVPGLAIAIVQDNKIVHLKGYGVLKEGEKNPVDEHTIFAIGSCTKEFTAAGLGILIDDGLLIWQTKAHTYLPQLQLPNECMTQELDVIDMLSHRSGLEEVGMLWDHTSLSRQELIQRIRFLKALVGFRQGWVYNNLLYLAVGELTSAVAGMSWDDFIAQRIFEPLHMQRSSTTIKALVNETNVAAPHYFYRSELHSVAYHNIDSISPAGGINSTITDMAQWLKTVVNKGVCDGVRLLKEDTMNELYSAESIVKKTYPFQLYGLGLGMFDYHGMEVVFHEGNIDGMSAAIACLPHKNFGIVILSNAHRCGITKVLMNTIIDRCMGIKSSIDWNVKFLAQEQEKQAKFFKEEQEKQHNRVQGTTPTYVISIKKSSLFEYTGTYHNDLYGDVVITQKDQQLTCQFLAYAGDLIHWENDTFTFDPSAQNPLLTSPFYFKFIADDNHIVSLFIDYADVWENSMKADFVKK